MAPGGLKADALEVILVDNHLLAVNKPAGLVTQPSDRHADSLETRAKVWLKKEFGKPGKVFLEAAHRLDRPVSGVVVFARTSKALARLNEAMRRAAPRKTYLALVEGRPPGASGTLKHFLRHDEFRATVVEPEEVGAREARLRYRTLRPAGPWTVLEIELLTGRYHQIRAQLGALGCPVAGDRRYGARHPWPAGGIALHHHCLGIEHPVRREPLHLTAPPPWDVG